MTTQLTTLFIFCAFLPLVPAVIVSTKYGKIEGLTTSCLSASGPFKFISKFLGVPFASPPVGDLRFKAPQHQRIGSRTFTLLKHMEISVGSVKPSNL